MKIRFFVSSLLFYSILSVTHSTLAQTFIYVRRGTPAFQSQQIESGSIQVVVTYERSSEYSNNLRYKITYKNQSSIENITNVYGGSTSIHINDLDDDRIPEVIVQEYTGGNHCCNRFKIYTWHQDKFLITDTGDLYGVNNSKFQDLDGDGKQELNTTDNSFAYAFSNFAGSFPPSRILAFSQGKITDVTRQYPNELHSRLKRMKQLLRSRSLGNNGILASYVAQKILLNEYQDGWNFMLASYDRSSTEGLTILKDGKAVGKYRNFPAALRALLIQKGYLDSQGRPITKAN
jgi:hypothetical protein